MSYEICSDVAGLREELDKMTDETIKTALGFINDMAIDMADDNGKIDLDQFLKTLKAQETPIHEWIADKYERELGSIEDHLTQIESELEDYAEMLKEVDHLELLDEISADVEELMKYGTVEQKLQYIEKLDNDKRLAENHCSRVNPTINLFGIIA